MSFIINPFTGKFDAIEKHRPQHLFSADFLDFDMWILTDMELNASNQLILLEQ